MNNTAHISPETIATLAMELTKEAMKQDQNSGRNASFEDHYTNLYTTFYQNIKTLTTSEANTSVKTHNTHQ